MSSFSGTLITFNGKDFKDQEEVGWGFSGLVLKSLHILTDRVLAKKIIHETPRKRMDGKGHREIEFYSKMMAAGGEWICENIVKCYGTLPIGGNGHIHGGLVFEFMDSGSLADFLQFNHHQPFPESIILFIAQSLLQACVQLESLRIVHRDIKPSNILFDSKAGVKLCDFGEACYGWESEDLDCSSSKMAGSTAYMSPERLACQPHSHSSDIWSVGLVILELTSNNFPFASNDFSTSSSSCASFDSDCSVIELWETVMETDHLPQVSRNSYSDDLVDLVNICMHRNPKERPSAKELLLKFSILFSTKSDSKNFINFINSHKQ